MKAELFVQLIISTILTVSSAGMVIGAFVKNSITEWKVYTIIMFVFCIFFIRQTYKELQQ